MDDPGFHAVVQRLERAQYTPLPAQRQAVCGIPVPHQLFVVIHYLCVGCGTERFDVAPFLVKSRYTHQPVHCLGKDCHSTEFRFNGLSFEAVNV